MGEVIHLDIPTTDDLPPEKILDAAKEHGIQDLIVIGRDPDGRLYMAACSASIGDNLLLVKVAERELVNMVYGD